ncbi:hypothetical protein OAS19_01460 [Altererythrobacter sp.]|nr:hypothetical protein [Altererythrobacter sp.]
MAKYQALTDFLSEVNQSKVTLSYESINDMLDGDLPDSAFKHRPWWANRTEGRGSQNLAWQSVGWETRDVNMELDEVTFVKVKADRPSQSRDSSCQKLSIAQAKAGLAAMFEVSEDAIDINIRG